MSAALLSRLNVVKSPVRDAQGDTAPVAETVATIPAEAKGPGDAFVNEAKRQVFGPVGIDQLAGPSEIFIPADETGNAEMIATDLLAQVEHDVRTRVGLITTHELLAHAVLADVARQLETLSTAAIASVALRDHGLIAVARDEADMIACSEEIAAEHLQVDTRDAMAFAQRLDDYGLTGFSCAEGAGRGRSDPGESAAGTAQRMVGRPFKGPAHAAEHVFGPVPADQLQPGRQVVNQAAGHRQRRMAGDAASAAAVSSSAVVRPARRATAASAIVSSIAWAPVRAAAAR